MQAWRCLGAIGDVHVCESVCVCVFEKQADICVGRDQHGERIRLSSQTLRAGGGGCGECDLGIVMSFEGNIAIWCQKKIEGGSHKSGLNLIRVI